MTRTDLMTQAAAARSLGVSRQWITGLITLGRLDVVPLDGRKYVTRASVDREAGRRARFVAASK